VTTSFRVEPDLLDEFRALALRNFRSPSWEFRRLMTEYIEEDKAA
jgi:predicted transcriptional regulator